ncbi:MAG: DUF4160 domain-containing protein [Actinomycetota bacterium]|nr:DUF4160 domain-containing protein [Actinomycetota bacterium]
MPKVCEFDGIVIIMWSDDHPPPHLHARYGSDEAKIELFTGLVMAGRLPPAQLRQVQQWRRARMWDLIKAWVRVRLGKTFKPPRPPG